MLSINDYALRIQGVQYENIPNLLKSGRRHIVWKPEQRGDKVSKTPYIARALNESHKYYKASSTNPRSWSTFPQAVKALGEHPDIRGIGRVLTDGIMLIDIDHSINHETQEIHPAAQEILSLFDTFAEQSPGDGIHIFPLAFLPADAKNVYTYKGLKIELYDTGRYSTITGIPLPSFPQILELKDQQAQVNALVERLSEWERENTSVCVCVLPSDDLAQQTTPTRAQQHRKTVVLSNSDNQAQHSTVPISERDLPLADRNILAKARAARNAATFTALWEGRDPRSRNDTSKADFDLVLMLLYWTNDNAEQTERLFRASSRYRPEKTDRKTTKSGHSYLQMTIYNAIKKRTGATKHQTPASNTSQQPEQLDPKPTTIPAPSTSKKRQPGRQDRRITHAHHWTRTNETPEQRQQKLQATAHLAAEQVEQHIRVGGRTLFVTNVPPGVGKSSTVAPLGLPGGLDLAWIAERRDMVSQVEALQFYRQIEPCTRHNCPDGFHLHQALGERGYNTQAVHKRHVCSYGCQHQQRGSAVYQLAHVRTKYPAHHEGIIIDELDITKWLPEREMSIGKLSAAARPYATGSTADLLLRTVAAVITDASQDGHPIHGLELFTALDRRCGGQLANWIGELEQDTHYKDPHPWYEIQETDPAAQELEVTTLAPIVLPHIIAALLQEWRRWQNGQPWNSCMRIGAGTHGWALHITERLRFTPGENGLPARAILDATADAEILARLTGEQVQLERAEIEPPPGTRHIAVRTGKRYGKKSLTTKRKNGSPNRDLQRAIAEARYILREEDPEGAACAAQTIGLISFMGCVDEMGKALGIPEHRRLHFWAARGSNALEDCTILLVIGTPTIHPATVARLARALYQDDSEPISEETSVDSRGIRCYTDHRMQRVNDYLTRAELTQCAHRSRALRQARIVITMCLGNIDYLPATETITELPQLLPDGSEHWTASREAEREKLKQASRVLEEEGRTVAMLTVRELKRAAGVSTDAAAEYLRQNRTVINTHTHTPVFSSVPDGANNNIHSNVRYTPVEQEPPAPEPDLERAILDYGAATDYPALHIEDVQIAAGRTAWLRFTWLSGTSVAQLCTVCDYIRTVGPPALAS